MLVPFDNFCGGSAPDVIGGVNSQQCINLYPAGTTGGKSPVVLRKCPGQELFENSAQSSTSVEPIYGAVYTTSLGDLFYIYSNGSTEFVRRRYKNGGVAIDGALSVSTIERVAFTDNGLALLVIGKNNLNFSVRFSDNLTSNLNTDPVFTGYSSSHAAYLDGYLIINRIGSNRIQVSPVDWDGVAAWSSLAFETDDQTPGDVLGLIVLGAELWTFRGGGYSVYYNAGTTPFPFARNQSVSNSIGLNAPQSLAAVNGRALWLGSGKDGKGRVFMSEGFNAVRISNPELEGLMAGYKSTEDAFGLGWQEYGHSFYSITFVTENVTWVYDLSVGVWHQRSSKLTAANVNQDGGAIVSYNPILSNGTYGAWNPIAIAEFNGELYIKSTGTGDILKLKRDVYTDDTLPIIWRRTAPFLSASGKRMFFNYLQIDMDTGTGLLPASAQGYDPIIFLRYSDDGGNTWSDPKQGKIGKIGKYTARVKWNRLGTSRNRLFEISGSDPVSTTIYQAFLDMEAENG